MTERPIFAMRYLIPSALVYILIKISQVDGSYTVAPGSIQLTASASEGLYVNRTNATYYPPTTSRTDIKPQSTGDIVSELEREGRLSVLPFPQPLLPSITLIKPGESPNSTGLASAQPTYPSYTTSEQVNLTDSLTRPSSSTIVEDPPARMEARAATDCFQPIATASLPPQISSRSDHPAQRLGITQFGPVSTNKFYANFFLGLQNQGVWTHPYSLTWSKGGGNLKSWGMAISHIDGSQRANGPVQTSIPGNPVQYFINPIGIQSIIFSATELSTTTRLTTKTLKAFSVEAVLSPRPASASNINFPCVQGMAFVTAMYTKLTPLIQSAVFFRSLVPTTSPTSGIYKYRITLEDGKVWLLYVTSSDGKDPKLQLQSNTQVQGSANWSGLIQVAKVPNGSSGESVYDASAGVYASRCTVTGAVSGSMGSYRLEWTKLGLLSGQTLLMFALPHHVQSFDQSTASRKTALFLQTTTKGVATAVVSDSWAFIESTLPVDVNFAPWSPFTGTRATLSTYAKNIIDQVARAELSQDINAQTNLDSMYFSGKALGKFATLVYVTAYLLQDTTLANQYLGQLETAFARFANNQQIYPLVYDSKWGGIVSSATYKTGDPNQDFGNSYYNDHHFHYGYFIYAAAVIGKLDPAWLSNNAAWVNTLVRDAGSPSNNDPQFPFSRAFDWYHGHSFAKGLFESADGKDEESTSEDAFFAYAIKLWGQVTGDQSMEARGNLMLAILTRSFDNYFLMKRGNSVQPSNFVANKVTGILFENKVDHTTYFGNAIEYIQGVHMLPLSPVSAYTRSQTFINEEWTSYFSKSSFRPASNVSGGWRGVLFGNLACVNPRAAWEFFSQQNFDPSWIDGGASRTWYLAFAAAIGGI